MNYSIRFNSTTNLKKIDLPASKSISNRLLIAQALSKNGFQIEGLSTAEDTLLLQKALQNSATEIDVGMAGTAFRFLTAYYSIVEGKRKLFGAKRMHDRPIGALVELLKQMGAEINYLEKEGFPPLEIRGKKLNGGDFSIDSGWSSQFISSVLLIAPCLQSPLKLRLTGTSVSKPYIQMTLALLKQLKVAVQFKNELIEVEYNGFDFNGTIRIEKDWSSAAFFYQMAAFGVQGIQLSDLSATSIQGDRNLIAIFKHFGVETIENAEGLELLKTADCQRTLEINLLDCPDLIPSVAVCAAVLMEKCTIHGVDTLRIKESDRVLALQNELAKIGAELKIIDASCIEIVGSKKLPETANFEVYNDHRMAMCLAPLAVSMEKIQIQTIEVVKKSFPNFWNELRKIGFYLSEA